MSQQIDGPVITGIASAALSQYRRVRLDSNGEIAYSSATDLDCIGNLRADVLAADAYAGVFVRNKQGTMIMVASEAITKGAAVYAAANGKVQTVTAGTVLVGEAMEAASADGDYLEVMPSPAAVLGSVARSGLTEDALKPYGIGLESMKLLTGLQLAATAAAGVFGVSTGTHGSATPQLVGEAASGNSKTDECRFSFALPAEYVSAGDVKVRVKARITGNVEVAQTIDVSAFESDGAAGVSAELCATAAQALTATFANYDFVITATDLVAGDLLDIKLTGVANDTGGTANKLIEVGAVSILCDIKG